jgi:hypothetical protein
MFSDGENILLSGSGSDEETNRLASYFIIDRLGRNFRILSAPGRA